MSFLSACAQHRRQIKSPHAARAAACLDAFLDGNPRDSQLRSPTVNKHDQSASCRAPVDVNCTFTVCRCR